MHYNGTPVGEQSLSYQKQRGKNKMRYDKICAGRFLARPNRFIAHVEVGGEVQVCHVKNTGRCRELLVPGARVWLEESANPARKTRYDLVAVEKQTARGALLINMDSQAPNKVLGEWLSAGGQLPGLPGPLSLIRPETVYRDSRFDFYLEGPGQSAFVEVKGITLEEDGAVYFPDAPTERGVKHLRELVDAAKEGYLAYAVFVIQLSPARFFAPNDRTHPAFGQALRQAAGEEVRLLAYDCQVSPEEIVLGQRVPIKL